MLERASEWFSDWSAGEVAAGRIDVVYDGEFAGMLELWADLYGETGNTRYLELASRYAMPDIFQTLLAGGDPLSNDHANASVPWIHGAARLFEVTGDERYRAVVKAFWQEAVETRGMFATTGNNAGEFWIPPQQFGRFLSARAQEHCTVYNMIRVAQYLLRWTGEARYADYIERALYNGVLAQQHPHTGMIAYFLPLNPGARKIWGAETTDFWCCHGSLVQAHALYESLIYYTADDGITVSQFVPSTAELAMGEQRVTVTQTVDPSADRNNFVSAGADTAWTIALLVVPAAAGEWTLRIRQPFWATAPGTVTVDGSKLNGEVSADGYLEIRRNWPAAATNLMVEFPKQLTAEPLPGDPTRFALRDGPVVLAALTDREVALESLDAITPQYEHQYVEGRDWQSGHFLARTPVGSVVLKPLYEIADETYTVYFSEAAAR